MNNEVDVTLGREKRSVAATVRITILCSGEAKHEDNDDFKDDTEKPPCKQRDKVKEKTPPRRSVVWSHGTWYDAPDARAGGSFNVAEEIQKKTGKTVGRQLGVIRRKEANVREGTV